MEDLLAIHRTGVPWEPKVIYATSPRQDAQKDPGRQGRLESLDPVGMETGQAALDPTEQADRRTVRLMETLRDYGGGSD